MALLPGRSEVAEGVVLDDNLRVLRSLPDGCVDLVYVDPPFGTGQVRRLRSIRTGAGDRTRTGFGGRRYPFEVVSSYRYVDDMAFEEYLGFLYDRLAEIHRVLRATGSLYLHLDFHAVHHARLVLDDIFGPERFLNEIIWAYDYGGRRVTAGPASTTTSCGTPNPPRGPSTEPTSTVSPIWRLAWWGRRKRLPASSLLTRGG